MVGKRLGRDRGEVGQGKEKITHTSVTFLILNHNQGYGSKGVRLG